MYENFFYCNCEKNHKMHRKITSWRSNTKEIVPQSHPKGRLIRLLATSSCWNLNKVKVYYRLWKDHPVQKYISAFLHLIRPHISIIFLFFSLMESPYQKDILWNRHSWYFWDKNTRKMKQFLRWRYFLFLERKNRSL